MAKNVQTWPIAAIFAAWAGSAMAEAPALVVPQGNPPPVNLLSPNPKLERKEADSASLAERWRKHYDRPTRGDDGTIQWQFGASLPSIVCAPLYVCDLALQPGEVVTSINAGDKVRWKLLPQVSGMGSTRTTHIAIKPVDAALSTNLVIYTDRRTYSIKLTSTQSQWTASTAFIYPDDQAAAWEQYHEASPSPAKFVGATSVGAANLKFYEISGDHPSWRPLHAYTDGIKTYIQFPDALPFSEAPALLGLNDDGNWFSNASQRAVRYRPEPGGTVWMVDGVENRLQLVMGVGSGATKVELRRPK